MLFGRKEVLVNINAQVIWQVARNPVTGRYTGICQTLNLNAIGDSMEEFLTCAQDAMQLLFVDLYEDDELAQFLRDRGWQIQNDLPTGGRRPVFDLPIGVEHVGQELLV